MTNDGIKHTSGFIAGATIKYDPATLTAPKSANFADVSTVNGSIYLDFGYIEYLVQLDKVQGVRNQPVQLVSRLVLSPDICIQVIEILGETLRRMGIVYQPLETAPGETAGETDAR